MIDINRLNKYNGWNTLKITKEDEKWLEEEMPDYIRVKDKEIQDLWKEIRFNEAILQNRPDRFINICYEKGGKPLEIVIDLLQNSSKGKLLKNRYLAEEKYYTYLERYKVYYKWRKEVREYSKKLDHLLSKINISQAATPYTEFIINCASKFWSVEEICASIKESYDVVILPKDVTKLISEYKSIIKKNQDAYLANSRDYRIATEAGRLEMLNRLLELWQRKLGDKPTKEVSDQIVKIIEQARKEVKGNELNLTIDGKIDINASLTGSNNVLRLMREISINDLVIGLTAAKAGLNPATLISQLTNSWYSDYNGFGANNVQTQDLRLPSALIKSYDWKELEKKSAAFVAEMKPIGEIIEYEEVSDETEAKSRKEAILKRLQELKPDN